MSRRWLVAFPLLALACGSSSRQTDAQNPNANGDACAAGKQSYAEHRQKLLDKLAESSCQVDADCALIYESNACVSTCGTPVPASGRDAATTDLQQFAGESCASCPPISVPPCVPPQPLVCKQGQCSGG